MTKGVLLFCFNTAETKYNKILEKCVRLIKRNLKLEITVVTDASTFLEMPHMGSINYKLMDPELGNKKAGKDWRNVDRHMAYELSPYDVTVVMDIDYLPFTDNLLQLLDTKYDFLISKHAHDLTGRDSFDHRRWSMIDMVWATVLIFRKGAKAKRIFDTVKHVKKYYQYYVEMYRIYDRNFRNDYAFAIALQQANGFLDFEQFPIRLPTLPPDCEVIELDDTGIAWKYQDQINYTTDQDVHVLNKEFANV